MDSISLTAHTQDPEQYITALEGLIALVLLSTVGNGGSVSIPVRWLPHTDKLEIFEGRSFDGNYNIGVRARQTAVEGSVAAV